MASFKFGDKVVAQYRDSGMGVVVGEIPTMSVGMMPIGRYMVIWERSGRSSFEDSRDLGPFPDPLTHGVRHLGYTSGQKRDAIPYRREYGDPNRVKGQPCAYTSWRWPGMGYFRQCLPPPDDIPAYWESIDYLGVNADARCIP